MAGGVGEKNLPGEEMRDGRSQYAMSPGKKPCSLYEEARGRGEKTGGTLGYSPILESWGESKNVDSYEGEGACSSQSFTPNAAASGVA